MKSPQVAQKRSELHSCVARCDTVLWSSLKIDFQRRLTKCRVLTDWCLTLDILCLTKNINAIEQI
jgi:hypothetical protein